MSMSKINKVEGMLLSVDDLFADSNTIPSVWNSFKDSIKSKTDEDNVIKSMVDWIEDKVINHLSLKDVDCMDVAATLVSIKDELSELEELLDPITRFIYLLASEVDKYFSINDNSDNNIHINMNESKFNILEESHLLYVMEHQGLVDSVKMQSLLDDQLSNITTTIPCCMGQNRNGETVIHAKRCGGSHTKAQPLLLQDFGIPLDDIITCCSKLRLCGVDEFPTNPTEFGDLIFNVNRFDQNKLFSRDYYVQNEANLYLLIAISQYITNAMELDNTTALYVLTRLMINIIKLEDILGTTQIIYYGKLLCTLMIHRYMTKESLIGSNDVTISLSECMTQAISDLAKCKTTSFKSEFRMITSISQLPKEYIDFIRMADVSDSLNGELTNFNETIGTKTSRNVISDELSDDLKSILNSLEDFDIVSEQLVGDKPILESAIEGISSLRVEQPSENAIASFQVLAKLADQVHAKLNESLLANNTIAVIDCLLLEVALKDYLVLKGSWKQSLDESICQSLDRIDYDISIYGKRLNGITDFEIRKDKATKIIQGVIESGENGLV